MALLLGAHVSSADPLGEAGALGAGAIQINLASPRVWQAPGRRADADADALATSGLAVFAHAPYLCNPASLNPEVRAKTRRCLQAHTDAAARAGVVGVVVHGGHPTGAGTLADAVAGWVEVMSGWEPAVPLLIENTAGGSAAVARHLESLAVLWAALEAMGANVGFCLDTCHAHAAGESLAGLVPRVLAVTGRIDLVHVNDSRDPAGSGRDRHANLGEGQCDLGALVEVVAAADAPAVLETPGGLEAVGADLDRLRGMLGQR